MSKTNLFTDYESTFDKVNSTFDLIRKFMLLMLTNSSKEPIDEISNLPMPETFLECLETKNATIFDQINILKKQRNIEYLYKLLTYYDETDGFKDQKHHLSLYFKVQFISFFYFFNVTRKDFYEFIIQFQLLYVKLIKDEIKKNDELCYKLDNLYEVDPLYVSEFVSFYLISIYRNLKISKSTICKWKTTI